MMRRLVLALGLAAICSAAAAQTVAATGSPTALGQQIAGLVADPAVSRAHWGVMITTLDGTPIYTLNEGQLFQPASNAKLYTTAAAMGLLGPNQRFTTRVEYGTVWPPPSEADRNAGRLLFPHGREFAFGGCAVGPDSPKSESVYVCGDCKKAYQKWKKEHPKGI